MRLSGPTAIASLLLVAACGSSPDAPPGTAGNAAAPLAANGQSAAPPPPSSSQGWSLQSSGEGAALALASASGGTTVRLFCPAGAGRLLVNVPGFRPVASEERLSFGSGGEVVALVADTNGDRQRGGVTGAGAVPANLAALIAGRVAINYGAQNSGPHPVPPADLVQSFVAACTDTSAATPPPTSTVGATACMMQGMDRLEVTPLRAVGTEPFWGARIEGRCVTYSHPDDQAGTRVWTRYTAGANGGTWVGALRGQRFELTTRAAPGCSDGMSDRRYPIAVDLLIGDERRSGCAAPR